MNIVEEARGAAAEALALRRRIHRRPEMGRQETETSALVRTTLEHLGIASQRVADTGVLGILKGRASGKTVALRADMDALPVTENTHLDFSSEIPGMMHACGHDFHTAALLGAARVLCAHRDTFDGEVRFLFQPDEENEGGAKRMIAEGCMDGVDAVYGAHVEPLLPVGTVGIRSGAAYASSNPFDITVRGKSAHGAQPDNGVDALLAAAEIVSALQTIVSRGVSPLQGAVVTVGLLRAGTVRNVIADSAVLNGTLRCFGETMRREMSRRVREVAEGIARAHGAHAQVTFLNAYDGIVNPPDNAALVQTVAEELLGAENVIVEEWPSMTTEDFGAFLQKASGAYWHIGVATPGKECAPLHSPSFVPDENAMPIAIAMHTALALRTLEG